MCTYWNVNYSENCGYNCHVVTEKNIFDKPPGWKKKTVFPKSVYTINYNYCESWQILEWHTLSMRRKIKMLAQNGSQTELCTIEI